MERKALGQSGHAPAALGMGLHLRAEVLLVEWAAVGSPQTNWLGRREGMTPPSGMGPAKGSHESLQAAFCVRPVEGPSVVCVPMGRGGGRGDKLRGYPL